MAKFKHRPKTIAAVRKLAAEGLSGAEIGRKLKQTKNVVAGIAYRNDIQLKSKQPAGWTEREWAEVKEALEEGLSVKEAGEMVGRSASALRNYAHSIGVKIGPIRRGERQ